MSPLQPQGPRAPDDASEASPQPDNGVPHAPSLRYISLHWLAATGILAFAVLLVIQDLMGANRPHELHNTPWVAGITLLNLRPCSRAFIGLIRYARMHRGKSERGLGFYSLVLGVAIVALLNSLILAGAVTTLPAVLFD